MERAFLIRDPGGRREEQRVVVRATERGGLPPGVIDPETGLDLE
jgi:hypothetical protein